MCCRGVQGIANPAYLEGFLFHGLPSVAPYCVPGGIRVVSTEAWLLHDRARSWHASEVRLVPREERKYPVYPRPLLTLDALDGKTRRRWDGRSLGVAPPLTGECKASQETWVVRSESTVAVKHSRSRISIQHYNI